MGRPEFDVCQECAALVASMKFVGAEGGREMERELASLRKEARTRAGDMQHVRESIAGALDAWGIGRDEEARRLLTQAGSRAATPS